MRISLVVVPASILAIVLFSGCNSAYALEENVGIAKIDPSSPIFFLKTVREELELKFAGTPRTKILRHLEFATRRLRESKALVGSQNEDLIQASLERYGVSFKKVLDFRPRDEGLTLLINHVIGVHVLEFDRMYEQLKSPKAKIALRSQVYYLIQNSDVSPQMRIFGCSFLLRESSSSGLSQTEQVILKMRADKCFDRLKPN